MADIPVPSIATATPAAADTVVGVQGGAVKRFAVSNLAKVGSFTQAGTGAAARTVESKLQDVVSVKDFGATGDGTTDDTVSVQAAFDHAASVGATVHVSLGTYLVHEVTLPANAGIDADAGAVFKHSLDGTCLTVESSVGSNLQGRTLRFPAIIKGDGAAPEWASSADSTSIGLRILGPMYYCDIYIPAVLRFDTGVLLDAPLNATTRNIVGNTFTLGRIGNCRIGLHLAGSASWGVNQNTFISGAIGVDAAYTTGVASWKIYMPVPETNGNTFVGVNLELGSATQLAIYCASNSNVWMNCRFEAGFETAGFITFAATAQNNKIISGAGGATTYVGPYDAFVSDAGFGNVYWYGSVLGAKSMRLDFQNAFPIWFGNGSSSPSVPIGAYGTNRLRLGNSNTVGGRYYGALLQEEKVQTSGTTLDGYANFYQFNYAAPATITTVTGGGQDQTTAGMLTLFDLNGNITIAHTAGPAAGSGKFVNKSGTDNVLVANRPVIYVACNGNFYEV